MSAVPKNISFLNLQLTLSKGYGVDDKTALRILSSFLVKLIVDDSVTPEIADEIFALTIVPALANRDKETIGRTLFLICRKSMPDENWITQRSIDKLKILDQQLTRFIQSIDPFITEAPKLLRVTIP